MRFSLRDLMAAVACCAGIAWCAVQVGFDSGMFWSVVGVLVFASGLFVYEARSRRGRRRALWVTLPLLVFALLGISIPIAFDATLLSLAVLFLARRPMPSVRTLCYIAMASFFTALLAGVVPGMIAVWRLEAVRSEMPIVSLASRLQYEQRQHSAISGAVVSNASIIKKLGDFEGELSANSFLKYQLERLHTHQYVLFERAMGFGMSRMIPLTSDSLRRPPLRDVRFGESTAEHERGGWRAFFGQSGSEGVERMHNTSRNDFLDPDGFGVAIEPPLKVTGFVDHAFHYPPVAAMDNPQNWKIERLELVSLLKFDTPRVYVLDHLPRMDQLSSDNAPTRPLDDFEAQALAKLRTTEDLVVSRKGTEYRMLGSLRAAKQCAECHSVARGELLGAFSYVLHGPAVAGHQEAVEKPAAARGCSPQKGVGSRFRPLNDL